MPIYKTKYGTFRVTINIDNKINLDTRTQIRKGQLLSVGGKHTCVFLNIPDSGDTAHLTNLKTKDGGCELTGKKISGQDTIGMVNLAFTIIKKIAPNIKYIKLEDKSDFACEFDNGVIVGISMIVYEMLIHQESYYEKRFGAYLLNDTMRSLYEKSKSGFLDKPPELFSFNNSDLENIFRPIYNESKTWKEFFDKIKNMPNLCQKLYPWYRNAIKHIFNNISFERQDWIIDLENSPKLFNVEFTEINGQYGGKRRKTRKQISYNYDIYNSDSFYNILNPDELRALKYL
jgi:hypothetical protein